VKENEIFQMKGLIMEEDEKDLDEQENDSNELEEEEKVLTDKTEC
jgi:hypothetical protein